MLRDFDFEEFFKWVASRSNEELEAIYQEAAEHTEDCEWFKDDDSIVYEMTPCGWPEDHSTTAKVVQCHYCMHRGLPDECPMCTEEEVEYDGESDWIIRDRTTEYGFCHLREEEHEY